MDSSDEFKEIDIKNCTYYYYSDMIKINLNLDNILIHKKSHENILVYIT